MKEADIRPLDLFNDYLTLARRDAESLAHASGQFTAVPCPGCGSAQQTPAFEKLGFSYVSCAACDSLYVSPRPSADQLAVFYREGASVKFWSTDFFRQTAESRRRNLFAPRAQLVQEFVGRHAERASSFVDIGSGYGVFLEEIQRLDRFSTVLGIEPGPTLAAVCRQRGFRVIEKPLEAVTPDECQVDVATAFEVVEHPFDPLQFVTAACQVLRPGGLLVLTTLTISGFDLQVLWDRSKSIHPPHHLNLLSIHGLQRLMERAGLELVELSTPGRLDVDIVANMVQENPTIPMPRFVRSLVQANDATRQAFQSFLSQHRLSSHVRVVARRPMETG